MSEKSGHTEKIMYDFNTASNLEVYMVNLKDWYRVTSREFRAYNGARRINGELYTGPVYLYNTNKRANKSTYESHKLAGYKWVSVSRGGN